MRSISRLQIVMVSLLGFFELLLLVAMLQDYKTPIGQYGFVTKTDGVTIADVEANKPAAIAGLSPGDLIHYDSLTLFGRHFLTLKEPVAANAALSFEVSNSRHTRYVTLIAEPMPMAFVKTTTVISGLSGFIFGVTGLILIIFRPSRMSWAFAFIAPELLLPSYFSFSAQHSTSYDGIFYDIFISFIYALQTTGMLMFASRFPHNKPQGLGVIIDRLSIPIGILIGILYIIVGVILRFTQFQLPYWIIIADFITLIPTLSALSVLIATTLSARENRSRLAPVIVSFMILIILGALAQITQDFSSSYHVLFTVSLAYAFAPILVAITVAYGVIRYKVMDINFILERTLVFSVLTAGIITLFAILEFFVTRLAEEHIAAIVQMGAAVIIGISMHHIHLRLNRFVKIVFFRKRYIAIKRLNKASLMMHQATSVEFVDDMLVQEPFQCLDLASAALFRKNLHGDYDRVAACGWDQNTTHHLHQNEHLIVELHTEMKVLNSDKSHWKTKNFPLGIANPILIIPIVAGNELEGLVCYGGHRTGEAIDIDERKTLQHLAKSAALAYVRLFGANLHKEVDSLNSQMKSLRQTNTQLENIITLSIKQNKEY